MPDFDIYEPRVGQKELPVKTAAQRQEEYFARIAKLSDDIEKVMLEMGQPGSSTWLYFDEEAPLEVEGLEEVGCEYVDLTPPVKREVLVVRDTSKPADDNPSSKNVGIMVMEKLWFERLHGIDYFTREATVNHEGNAFAKTGLVYCSRLEEDGKGGLIGASPNSQEVKIHYLDPSTNMFHSQQKGRVIFMNTPTFRCYAPLLSSPNEDGVERSVIPTGLSRNPTDAMHSLSVAEDLWATVKGEVPTDAGSFIEGFIKYG